MGNETPSQQRRELQLLGNINKLSFRSLFGLSIQPRHMVLILPSKQVRIHGYLMTIAQSRH